MDTSPGSWRKPAFFLATVGCIQFIVLTTAAFFLYPGGTHSDNTTTGYLFGENFFSDLGRVTAHSGDSNTASMILFVIALSLGGVALMLFFVAIPHHFRQTRTIRRLSTIGSTVGVVSAISFIGIASVPADVNEGLHRLFVDAAFSSFLLVVVCYSIAIFKNRSYPNAYAFVYLGFAVILAGYLWLLFAGPNPDTDSGVRIQATGQKIVVYAVILCMFIQAYGAFRIEGLRTSMPARILPEVRKHREDRA